MTVYRRRIISISILTAIVVATAGLPVAADKANGGRRAQRLMMAPGTRVYRDVEYARVDKASLKLDLYVPPHERGVRLPVVVWIHGGGWRAGSKNHCPALFMTRSGYAVASINYRLSQVAKFPAQIHDCKGAVRWLRAKARAHDLDADNIGVWGASAGGHLSALLGTSADVDALEGKVGGNLDYDSRVQAVCDFFGPADLTVLARWAELADGHGKSVLHQFIGGTLAEKGRQYRQASPVTHVTADDAPFLIVHGTEDRIVPVDQSQRLHAALTKAKVPSTLEIVKGAGHGPGIMTRQMGEKVRKFFDRHLKPKAK